MITNTRAQRIASDWYDGDGSGLYLIVCNLSYSRLSYSELCRAKTEVNDLLKTLSYAMKEKERESLKALESWLAKKIEWRMKRDKKER